jgi:hypothetical protein
VPDEPVPDDAAGLRAANARLRAVVEAGAAEIEALAGKPWLPPLPAIN